MVVGFGTSMAGVASASYLGDILYCRRLQPNACPMYLASSVLGLVAAVFSSATIVRLFFARAAVHQD
jgi:hypothetical protein